MPAADGLMRRIPHGDTISASGLGGPLQAAINKASNNSSGKANFLTNNLHVVKSWLFIMN
jgi:hypothetical protein